MSASSSLDLATDHLSPKSIWVRHTADLYKLPVTLGHEDLARLGIRWSNVHLLKLEKSDRFPKRIGLGGVTTVWSTTEVLGWLFDRAAEREAASAKRSSSVRGVVDQREAKRSAPAV